MNHVSIFLRNTETALAHYDLWRCTLLAQLSARLASEDKDISLYGDIGKRGKKILNRALL